MHRVAQEGRKSPLERVLGGRFGSQATLYGVTSLCEITVSGAEYSRPKNIDNY